MTTPTELRVLQFCHGYDGPFLDCARQYASLFVGTPYKVTTVYLTGAPSVEVERGSASDEVVFLDYRSRDVRGLKLKAIRDIKRLVVGRNFQFCIAHRFKPIYVALLGTNLPVIGVHHGFGDYQRLSRKLFANCFRKRLALLGVSNAVRDEIRACLPSWPAERIETLYNRIHEVRMRFEVLKRDAEIAMLRAVAAGEAETAARVRLEAEWRALDDDFAFVASCNQGGEVMAPEKLDRLRQIARRTWLRTLDDSIGISHEEKARRAGQPAATLPVVEQVIADKPEHCLPRRPADHLAPDNPLGIRMPAPEHLYNRGELYNLSVARGTLSEEERFKINDHIVQTLIMLDQLPYPRHLRTVPEIAGGHHEKMDGSGYPRRLQREQMSPQARMLAIADIFEALTAVDRPYKQGKKLSEAIRIMATMKRDQHIDPDLFDLFLSAGVFRRYAEKHMRPEQIDAVDIAPHLG